MAALELVDQANWYVPHRHKADGSYWRLDAGDKYQQRFLIRIDEPSAWATFDSRPLEKALLLEARGGLTDAACLRLGCALPALKRSAFCVDHTYERGVWK